MSSFIEILRKGKYDLSTFIDSLEYLRNVKWKSDTWKLSPALIDKSGGTIRSYIGQQFDEKYFDLVPDGWTHDHCEICNIEISDGENAYQSEDNDWVCEDCFNDFLEPDNIEEVIKRLN